MRTEADLNTRFADFQAATAPVMSGPGGAAARATVRRRRQRLTAGVAVILAVVVAAIGLVSREAAPNRLVAAKPPAPSPSPSPPPSPSWDPYLGVPPYLRNATLDLRQIGTKPCGGQVVQLKDNFKSLSRQYEGGGERTTIFSFGLLGAPMVYGDLNGDGVRDLAIVVDCVAEGAGSSHQWLMYFTDNAPRLTAWLVFPAEMDDGKFSSSPTRGPVVRTSFLTGGKPRTWAYDTRTHQLTEVPR